MPNIENHMDDLFQKAAENYPLNIKPGNFDDLLPVVGHQAANTVAPAASKRNGKYKTALLLLAFLFTGGIITAYLMNNSNQNSSLNKIAISDNLNDKTAQHQNSQLKTTDFTNTENTIANNEGQPNEATGIFNRDNTRLFNKAKLSARITAGSIVSEGTNADLYRPGISLINIHKASPVADNDESNVIKQSTPETKKEKAEDIKLKDELNNTELKASAKNDKKKKIRPTIYYGLSAGVELNQVKNQGMTKPGLNAGLVLGLQINKKISVETRIQVSQKKYYTTGRHFNPKTGEMPSNMTVNSLEGNSTLIEIPVSVKYNLSKKSNGFYGKAGVSSYIMTREANKYQAVVSGQEKEINSTYKNTKMYTAAELRISAGYQHEVGKKLNIRVEPYIQIPLKGIGVGGLPVTSTGLQLVLTRN